MDNVAVQHIKSSGRADKSRKLFDKKKYREQKYSNKYKVNSWKDKRKKMFLRGLHTDIIRTKQGISVKASNSVEYANNAAASLEIKGKPNLLLLAKLQYKRRQDEKRQKKEELLKAKQERDEALKKYKEKRTETYKKLSRKTKKGQPVMKDRLELLLAKIQNDT